MVGKINENKSQTYGFDAQIEQYVDMRAPASSTRRRSFVSHCRTPRQSPA